MSQKQAKQPSTHIPQLLQPATLLNALLMSPFGISVGLQRYYTIKNNRIEIKSSRKAARQTVNQRVNASNNIPARATL